MYSHPDRGNVTKQEFLTRMFDSLGLNYSVPSASLLPAMPFLSKWNLVVLSYWKRSEATHY